MFLIIHVDFSLGIRLMNRAFTQSIRLSNISLCSEESIIINRSLFRTVNVELKLVVLRIVVVVVIKRSFKFPQGYTKVLRELKLN